MAKKRQQADDRPRGVDEVHKLHTYRRLTENWPKVMALRRPDRDDATLVGGEISPNPLLYDPECGLGLLARVVCLRSVFRHMVLRDSRIARKAAPKTNDPGQICLRSREHAKSLFNLSAQAPAKGQGLSNADDALVAVGDPRWRQWICDGVDDHGLRVGGLNKWFGDRYAQTLEGSRITPSQLFGMPFFGASAPAHYVRFLLSGLSVPDCNVSLSTRARIADPKRDIECVPDGGFEELLTKLRTAPNEGRPIVTVQCEGSAAMGSRLAASIVDNLRGPSGKSACYLPVRKGFGAGPIGDHGFRSIVEALERFVCGHEDLTPRLARSWTEKELAQAIRAIRAHLTRVATVVVFDGFVGDADILPATVDFIRDEPISRLLRLLQHPDFGAPDAPNTLSAFRGTYFVVVGQPSPGWLAMHRNQTFAFRLSPHGLRDLLKGSDYGPLLRRWPRTNVETTTIGTDALQALSALVARAIPSSPHLDSDTLAGMLETYLATLAPWQRLLLQGLALSETGLRLPTIWQLISVAGPVACPGADGTSLDELPYDEFVRFMKYHSAPREEALLFTYNEGNDALAADGFAVPEQTLVRLHDWHPWIVGARRDRAAAAETLDFVNPVVRRLIRTSIPRATERVLRRVLAELALQAYRVRIRHSDPQRRVGRRAARNLVEALYHGMHSIDFECDDQNIDDAIRNLRAGEVPGDPAEAFSFLYFTVYRALLCAGNVTSLGRVHGNGSLELELLVFTGDRLANATRLHEPNAGTRVDPVWADWRLGTASPRPFRKAAVDHLFALARCARRATRVELLKGVLSTLRTGYARDLDPRQQLELCKFEIDLSMRTHSRTDGANLLAWRVWRSTQRALQNVLFDDRASPERARRAREIAKGFWDMRRRIRCMVDSDWQGKLTHEGLHPTQIDRIVQGYVDVILTHTKLERLSHDVLTLATRLAILQGNVARARRGHSSIKHAVVLHLQSIAIYWLIHRLASRRARETPLLARSVLGADNAQEYIACAVNLRDLLVESVPGGHATLIERLDMTMRRTLDTFSREQGVDKADHILSQILESDFTRNVTAVTPAVVRKAEAAGAHLGIDDLLRPLWRCYRWLYDAEREMLSFSSRPTLRVVLCIDRINCGLEAVRRAYGDETRRVRGTGTGVRSIPASLLEWMGNDLLQIEALGDFMETYSPEAEFLIAAWRSVLRQKCRQVKKAVTLAADVDAGLAVPSTELRALADSLLARAATTTMFSRSESGGRGRSSLIAGIADGGRSTLVRSIDRGTGGDDVHPCDDGARDEDRG